MEIDKLKHIKIDESWKSVLQAEFLKDYFSNIKSFLLQEKSENKVIFPPSSKIFSAFDHTPFHDLKIVILGQDPYHGVGQANGLCFSVNRGVAIPASLKNIFKEIKRDLNIDNYKHGDLTAWADQGVFLLNTILTVEQGKAASHQNIGWNLFTDAVIEKISQLQDQVIFMLWGNHAKAKKNLIDSSKHYVLESVHPSPLAGGKFIGCGHFGQANELLKKHGKTPINWELPQ